MLMDVAVLTSGFGLSSFTLARLYCAHQDTSPKYASALLKPEAVHPVVEAAPAALGPQSKVKILDFDKFYKPKDTVVAHGFIVSLAGGTMHNRMIEEGNALVMITEVEPGSE